MRSYGTNYTRVVEGWTRAGRQPSTKPYYRTVDYPSCNVVLVINPGFPENIEGRWLRLVRQDAMYRRLLVLMAASALIGTAWGASPSGRSSWTERPARQWKGGRGAVKPARLAGRLTHRTAMRVVQLPT